MSCGGCAASVKRAVASLDAAAQVDVDLTRGHAQVHTERQQAEIETKIREGYDPCNRKLVELDTGSLHQRHNLDKIFDRGILRGIRRRDL